MSQITSTTKPSRNFQIIFAIGVLFYLVAGIVTERLFIEWNPIPETLLSDFSYYEQALENALDGKDPYSRDIGTGYLYPPQALLIVEVFHTITFFQIKIFIYSAFNITLLFLIVLGKKTRLQ